MPRATSEANGPLRRRIVPVGLALTVFSIVALSGPGRIDIVDGQTRYEVARSLVDHRDSVIRNPDVWFGVFPGRDGAPHTYYRFPQSVIGAAAVVVSDITGPRTEARRHFFFSLTSAAAASLLTIVYFSWFRRRGLTVVGASFWAASGILCTPSWYYGTSTFDEILGTVVVTFAVTTSLKSRSASGRALHLAAGMLFGLAFNCKQPLGAFVLAGIVAGDDPSKLPRERLLRASLMLFGLAVGIGAYVFYDLWKFPLGKSEHVELLKQYFPAFLDQPSVVLAVLSLTFSPAAGALWYCPPLLMSVQGIRRYGKNSQWFVRSLMASLLVFVGFICTISFFKGDPAWGPRYLTPVFAILWLFSADGARSFNVVALTAVLSLGLLVQALGLAVDPYRLYISRGLPSTFGAIEPVLYFDPANSHLLNRPREIVEVWRARHEAGIAFTPWQVPTSTPTIIDREVLDPGAVRQYKLLNSFRPFWASHQYIAPGDRPVDIRAALGTLSAGLMIGLALLALGLARVDKRQSASSKTNLRT